jgi:hypothetical protein
MQIRRKNVDGANLVVQYLVGAQNPYLGFHVIRTETNADATALSNLPDNELVVRLGQELGGQMLADLRSAYK